MKKKFAMFALILPVTFFSISHRVTAQDSTASNYENNAQVDSLTQARNQEEAVKVEERRKAENLSDLKLEKKETRGKAKEAQRVERDASDAASASRMAYRKEKRAQRTREQADKQVKQAEKARKISDRN